MLYLFLKSLLKKDHSALRSSAINYYQKQSYQIKLASLFYNHNPPIFKFALGLLYQSRLLFWHLDLPSQNILPVAVRDNEKKSLKEHLGKEIAVYSGRLEPFLNLKNLKVIFNFITSPKRKTYLRLALRLSKKLGFVEYLRVLDYLSFSLLYQNIKVNSFIHSSEGDPLINALCAIVKKKKGFICFIDHGLIPLPFCCFPFDKIIVTSKRNYLQLKKSRPLENKVFLSEAILRCDKLSLNVHSQKIGIVDSLLNDNEHLRKVVQSLHSQFPSFKIIFRPHPNRVQGIPSLPSMVVDENSDFSDCLFILCGNSGHAVKVLEKGLPVLYDPKLDHAPYDLYCLVRDGILLEVNGLRSIDLRTVRSFYSSETWQEKWKENFV
jgi:hypothetical protein